MVMQATIMQRGFHSIAIVWGHETPTFKKRFNICTPTMQL